jgi:hypothetical protein
MNMRESLLAVVWCFAIALCAYIFIRPVDKHRPSVFDRPPTPKMFLAMMLVAWLIGVGIAIIP